MIYMLFDILAVLHLSMHGRLLSLQCFTHIKLCVREKLDMHAAAASLHGFKLDLMCQSDLRLICQSSAPYCTSHNSTVLEVPLLWSRNVRRPSSPLHKSASSMV